ncbi:MAG: S41 family peptidase [Chloroflexi bacterium]|nr:S41 family peptidase [Chloroflexota bacterium]
MTNKSGDQKAQPLLRLLAMATLSGALLTGTFLAGYGVSWFSRPDVQYPVGEVSEELEQSFRVYWEAWHRIEESFYTEAPLDQQEMIYGAIRGTVDSLGDDHTVWVDPAAAAVLEEDLSGSFEGIGASVNNVDGFLTVVAPLPNSPAEQAGIRAGDIILEADGRPLEGLGVLQAVALIRGPEGTSVRLLVRRLAEDEASEFEVTIVRAKLDFATVEYRVLPEGPGYLRLNEFNAQASDQVHEALADLIKQRPTGLILDLRNNPGGLLSAAVDIASEFLDRGLVLIERKSLGDEGVEYTARGGGIATEIPLVVLVNEGSASASEIVAGAVQDRQRGTLIGSTTFGKGSMQIPYALSDGSSLVLTIARWYTPNGRGIDGEGLEPDILVEMDPSAVLSDQDAQLQRAIEYLLEKQAR